MRPRPRERLITLVLTTTQSYVNHLEESDFQKKETLGVLRQLRLNVSTEPVSARVQRLMTWTA